MPRQLFLFLLLLFLARGSSYSQKRDELIRAYPALNELANALPDAKVYFIGQAHGNQANNIIIAQLVRQLHHTRKLNTILLEWGHSGAVLLNHYLETGDENVLRTLNKEADFALVKFIKSVNDTSTQKLSFAGIDFEHRYNGRITFEALQLIRNNSGIPKEHILDTLLTIQAGLSVSAIEKQANRIRDYLTNNENECRSVLKKYYKDLLMIVSAPFEFKSRRDNEMYDLFRIYYNESVKDGESPVFLASFGFAHLNPSYEKGIANRLNTTNYSPVFGAVSVTGVTYINSYFEGTRLKETDGSLRTNCVKEYMKELFANKSPSITFVSRSKLQAMYCAKVNSFDALLVISNYGSHPYWFWE